MEKRFFIEIFNDAVIVPKLLLKYYRYLEMSSDECLFLIEFLAANKDIDHCLLLGELVEDYNIEVAYAKEKLASLIEKGYVELEQRTDIEGNKISCYVLIGIYDRLMEIWACEKAGGMKKGQDSKNFQKSKTQPVYNAFENEFGRPLTPLELEKIIDWLEKDKYHTEVVLEALKRATLRNISNINYIDRILISWQKNNLRSLRDILAYEQKKNQTKSRSNRKSNTFEQTQPERNYNKLYEN